MYGYVGGMPIYHPEMQRNGHGKGLGYPGSGINPLTAGLLGVGLGILGGSLINSGPGFGPGYGPFYGPGFGYGPGYGYYGSPFGYGPYGFY